jgi:hypothetical protein
VSLGRRYIVSLGRVELPQTGGETRGRDATTRSPKADSLMEIELRDWFDLAAQRPLNDLERHSAAVLEQRIDRLRAIMSVG